MVDREMGATPMKTMEHTLVFRNQIHVGPHKLLLQLEQMMEMVHKTNIWWDQSCLAIILVYVQRHCKLVFHRYPNTQHQSRKRRQSKPR